MNSPLKRIGGKYFMVKNLKMFVPKHEVYIEPFFGAGHFFFAKRPSKIEIINDIDSNVYTFFKVLQDENKSKELIRLLENTPYSREVFKNTQQEIKTELDDIIRAKDFFILARMSFAGGIISGFSYGVDVKFTKSFTNIVAHLFQIRERLKNAIIEKLDFFDLWNRYISDIETKKRISFIYLDPPYVNSTRKEILYEHETDIDFHKRFIELLLQYTNSKFLKILLSGYDNELYQSLVEAGWKKKEFSTQQFMNTTTQNTKERTECLWYNYKLPEQLSIDSDYEEDQW